MNCSKANKSLKLEHIFDDLENSVVTDDLAFGEMTGALTFIKLTQRTGCAMNWSFGNQLQLQVARS